MTSFLTAQPRPAKSVIELAPAVRAAAWAFIWSACAAAERQGCEAAAAQRASALHADRAPTHRVGADLLLLEPLPPADAGPAGADGLGGGGGRGGGAEEREAEEEGGGEARHLGELFDLGERKACYFFGGFGGATRLVKTGCGHAGVRSRS